MSDGLNSGSVTLFFDQLRRGDPGAAEQLWRRFHPRLTALACQCLRGRPQAAADAEDAVQSAFASFCHRVRAGQFAIDNRGDLWNLLGLITKRKARAQLRRELADKRGGGRIVHEGMLLEGDVRPWSLDDAVDELPAPEFDVHVSELLEQLDPELREIAVCRLMGFRNREIADRLDCTERKVERKLQLLRMIWEAEWPHT